MRYSSKQSLRGYDKAAQGSITPTIAGYVVVSDPRLPHEIEEGGQNEDTPVVPRHNYILYERPFKLTETQTTTVAGLHTDKFEGANGQPLTMVSHTFENGIGKIEFDGDVIKIGANAFYGASFSKVEMPDSVTTIGFRAFKKCSLLETINIGQNITTIEDNAFQECTGLQGVYISDLEAWCNINFVGTTSQPLAYAHHLYLGENEITSLTIPNSITKVNSYAFYGANNITNLTIPNTVIEIGNSAFNNTGITSLTIPDSVMFIRGSAFNNCNNLTNVTIGNGPTEIGASFQNCSKLSSMVIGTGAASLGQQIFKDTPIKNITCYAMVAPTIQQFTFKDFPYPNKGVLTVPIGSSGYDIWMSAAQYYLGYYDWTMVEQ